MLTNTASDQDSRAIQVRTQDTFCPFHPAALIAGDGAQSVASPRMGWCSHEPDVQPIRSSIRSLVLCADAQRVSDQPASLREPYTAISAAITATDRLIADGMQVGYLHAASSLTGFTGGGVDSPSTQRPNLAGRHGPRRCVLGPTVASQAQRGGNAALWSALHCRVQGGVGWIGKCSVHASRPILDRMRSATSARLKRIRPRIGCPMRIARMPPTWPLVRASRRTDDSLMSNTRASSDALYVFRSGSRSGLRVMLAPSQYSSEA